jgi:predicted permease
MSGRGVKSMHARRTLVVLQVAIAAVLLSGMGLAARSLKAVQGVDLGFEPGAVLTASVNPPRTTYAEAEEVDIFYDRAFAEIEAVPGVRAVSSVGRLPLNHSTSVTGYSSPAQVPAELEDWSLALENEVSPGYFGVMGVPVVAGREFARSDTDDSQPVVIISERLAGEPWLNDSPIGQTIVIGGEPDDQTLATIVGVVGDVRFEGVTGEERPQIYVPIDQSSRRSRYVVVASNGTPSSVAGSVRRAFSNVDDDLPITVRTMNDIVSENVLPWTISSALLSVLGGGALLLAVLGLYGVIAYSVAQRQPEIGVRMALGAGEGRIRTFFLREGLVLTAIGLAIGLVVAIVASNALAAALFGIGPFDLVTFVGVVVLFGGVAAVATLIPATRASKLDAVEVLRYE